MIDLPPHFYIDSTLEIGTVYLFEASELIKTDIPHFFIVIAKDEDDVFLLACTSKPETKEKHFERMGYDIATLVHIPPDKENGFTKDTYVDCNDYHPISKSRLAEKVKNGLKRTGKISYNHFDQLRTGLINSTVVDLPGEILVHPNDTE